MATLLLGYDVEHDTPEVTGAFLDQAAKVHQSFEAPCTLFVTGTTLEKNVEALKTAAARPDLFDIQSHTYSHALLKTVCQDIDGKITVWRGGPFDSLREEISRSVELTRRLLGVEVIGLCGPWCYYRGLCDRPDILELARDCGIRFTRTWGRNEKDWQPTGLSLQPFWYEPQGFADILELPVHGWQDCIWRSEFGWSDTKGFMDYQCSLVDEAAEKDLVLNLCAHDWSAIREDPEMTIVQGILARARERGMRVMSSRSYYEEQKGLRASPVP